MSGPFVWPVSGVPGPASESRGFGEQAQVAEVQKSEQLAEKRNIEVSINDETDEELNDAHSLSEYNVGEHTVFTALFGDNNGGRIEHLNRWNRCYFNICIFIFYLFSVLLQISNKIRKIFY